MSANSTTLAHAHPRASDPPCERRCPLNENRDWSREGWTPPSLDDVLAILHVAPDGVGRFTGSSIAMPHGRIFGGQVLGQVLMAAAATVPDKQVKSVYVQFPRDGRSTVPVQIQVEVHHDGRTYATCDVRVSQDERVLAHATVSLHQPGRGPEQQSVSLLHPDPEAAVEMALGLIPCETRVVDGVDLHDPAPGPAEFAFWMRASALDAPLELHQALLAFASDLSPIGTGLRPIPDLSTADNDRLIQTATTSHTMWFHEPVDLRDWVAFQQVSPMTGGGRSFCWGQCLDRHGVLVASYAQDSMIRWFEPRP